jgi:hypothetical protein
MEAFHSHLEGTEVSLPDSSSPNQLAEEREIPLVFCWPRQGSPSPLCTLVMIAQSSCSAGSVFLPSL